MAGRQIQVDIMGHTYSIRGEADEEYIRRIASFVDEKMRIVRNRNAAAPPLEAAVMVAINIADELFRERAQAQDISGMMEDKVQELAQVLQGV